MAKLTEKQKRFADYYIELGNATQAAIKAAYSNKYVNTNASKILQNTTLKNYIDERLKQLEDKRIASSAEVLKYLTSVLRGESKSEVAVIEGSGNGCSDARLMMKAPDEKERLKAAELLGRRFGLYTDKVDVRETVSTVHVYLPSNGREKSLE